MTEPESSGVAPSSACLLTGACTAHMESATRGKSFFAPDPLDAELGVAGGLTLDKPGPLPSRSGSTRRTG
jgi:hypothetical protein